MAKNTNDKNSDRVSGFWKRMNPFKTNARQQRVDFIFKAPEACGVSVAGSFNQWIPGKFRLGREGVGAWKGTFSLKPGVYEYRYYVDGQWVDDPGAKKTVVNTLTAGEGYAADV